MCFSVFLGTLNKYVVETQLTSEGGKINWTAFLIFFHETQQSIGK